MVSKKTDRRAYRPYVRRGVAGEDRAGAGPAARLAARAGNGVGRWGERATVDALEPRKMLFAVTIGAGDVDPATGLGTVAGQFPYWIPYLFAPLPQVQVVQPTIEEFNDEQGQWAGQVPAVPPSGTFFSQSDIQVSYSPTGARVQLEPGFQQPGDQQDDRDLKVTLTGDGFASFSFFQGVQEGRPQLHLTANASFVIGRSFLTPPTPDGDGLNTSATGTKVQLLRQGAVVATFSGAALAALGTPVAGAAGDTRFDFNLQTGFDTVKFSSAQNAPDNATYSDDFRIDDIRTTFPGTEFQDFDAQRKFWAAFTFTGPVGATVDFKDVYGREMAETDFNPDPLNTGLISGNDGIGQIIFSNTDVRTNFTMIGKVAPSLTQPPQLPQDPGGFMDEFEQAGFGFALTNQVPPQVIGLPGAGASVIIGSPFVRDNSTPANYLRNPPPPTPAAFNRADQGIRVTNGASIGSVEIHGIMMGSSTFTGAVGRYAVGLLLGSTTIQGDLGALFVASDAGLWVRDDLSPAAMNQSGAQFTVGRVAGQMIIGARSRMNVTVIGDLNNPSRPRLNFHDYAEQEVVYGFNPQTQDGKRVSLQVTLNSNPDAGSEAVIMGAEYFRNDTIMGAEFVGANSSGVQITGQLGQQDPVNTDEDPSDVYAFAADGSTDVVVSTQIVAAQNFNQVLARIVDQDGRVLASHQLVGNDLHATPGQAGVQFSFRPDHADVYYLVIATPQDGQFGSSLPYRMTLTGLAPTTLGMYRSGARTGFRGPATDGGTPSVITVQSGSMGTMRVGTGYVGGDGTEKDTTDVQNTDEGVDDNFNWGITTLSVAGDLMNITTGSDVNGAQVIVGGRLGRLVTGMSEVVGTGSNQGDLNSLDLTVGSTIGLIDVRGAISWDQDPPGGPAGPTFIRSGSNGGNGNIGGILVGAFINSDRDGNSFIVRTSPGSTIDRFLVGVTGGDGGLNGDLTRGTPHFNLGAGSDIRFVDFDTIQTASDPNAFRTVTPALPAVLSDDSGTTVTIQIIGGTAGSFATVRFLPIDGSQGVAIGRVAATLNGGAELRITGTGPGVASIGHIVVTTDGGTVASTVTITGTAQVDVWKIEQAGGNPLNIVQNSTPGGDLVSVDVVGLNQLIVGGGDLGRTQTNGVGPKLLGSFLGVQGGLNQQVGGPLGVTNLAINPNWGGGIFIPVNAPAAPDGGETLEDLGAPFGGYLNGLAVRTGNVAQVVVNGAVGDVFLQGNGTLTALSVNHDGVHLTPGAFEGIVGTIYATNIGTVDVGDGVAPPGPSPFAQAGIFADDDIQAVVGGRGLNPVIRGVIVADNQNLTPGPNNDGLVAVRLENGRFDGAYLGSTFFDWFWNSARYESGRRLDEAQGTGEVVNVLGINSDLFRSQMLAINITNVTLTGGAFDASHLVANGNIVQVLADEFRNSTRLGEPTEFRVSELEATGDLGLVATNNRAGDITDLVVDIRGSVTNSISAANATRLDLNVDHTVQDLSMVNDIRGSTITSGHLVRAMAGGDIRSTEFDVAGPIEQIIATNNITSMTVNNTGPDGRIDLIQAGMFLTGNISSSGPIGTITSVNGDIVGSIKTTDTDGTLNLLNAGHTLLVSLDIASNINQIVAGADIGSVNDPRGSRAINVRGSLNSIEARGGQIYTDVSVGQAITGFVREAKVAALPGFDLVSHATIRAFGPINLVDIHGDLNGSIISESGGITLVQITDGSFRPGNQIVARDGGIGQVIITGGHLMGDVISDEFIQAVRVLPGANGFWGDIGVNPNLSTTTAFDGQRNQLPPGAVLLPTFQGPRIQAGTDIGTVEVQKGSMWESAIIAGHSITRVFVLGVVLNDAITPGLGGSFIVAGDSIGSVEVGQFVGGAIIGAGILDLGADGRPGGTGPNTDTVEFGRIGDLIFHGGTGAVTIVAGMNAGADGIYGINRGPDGLLGTADDFNDDAVADGMSIINSVNVAGAALETQVMADNGIGFTSPGIIRGGPGLHQANPGRVIEFAPATGAIPSGVRTPFTTPAGETGFITFTGPGQAYYEQVFDAALGRNIGRLAIINSTLASRVTVDTNQNSLTDFKVISNDGASLGYGSFRGNMLGASGFYFDGYVQYVEFGWLNTTGLIGAGNDIGTLVFGPTLNGHVFANYVATIIDGGDFGLPDRTGEAVMDVVGAGAVLIGGNNSGLINSQREIGTVQINGGMVNGAVRSGRSIGTFSTAFMSQSRVSTRNGITAVSIPGDVVDSTIYGGADLGTDGDFGGSGSAADTVTDGTIGSVSIGGSFIRSDIGAGVARGADGYLGTADDIVDEGRSSLGPVVIRGQAAGSSLGSQAYRIESNGTLGAVTAGGAAFNQSGNLIAQAVSTTNVPLQVSDLRIGYDAGLYTATIQFNQPIVASTLSSALRISEVRSGGVEIVLAEGSDYTVAYDGLRNAATVTFSQNVTSRPLPVTPGLPGPGVYRFLLRSAVLRGQTQAALLDGNNDGFAAPGGDDFSQDAVVGDAGDKLVDSVVINGATTINFRAPVDLNLVLDNNQFPDGLPDTNHTITLRGVLGDHPNQNVNDFGSGGDADLYRVTLRAGQILRLGQIKGNALLATRAILALDGTPLASDTAGQRTGGQNSPILALPANVAAADETTQQDNYLVMVTGTYLILVTGDPAGVQVADPNAVDNVQPSAGATGDYSFTINVFDDGDTGFAGDTDSGDGVRVVNAPTPIQFAGPDGVLGTGDDAAALNVGGYVFTYDPRADNGRGLVTGSNGAGITSQRTSGANGLFGDADDAVVSFVAASIGDAGASGVPGDVQPDVDVYHLNNHDPILPGTVIRATLQLTELGSNLGLTKDPLAQDLRGDVQFALFDTSGATGVSDALLVASSSDAKGVGGQTPRTVSNGTTSYGYDQNGDFFIQFVTPARQGVAGNAPASYAIYVQGAIRTDYTMTIVTQGTASTTPAAQNVFIETRGGIINWLEAGDGVTTALAPYTTRALGFTGTINGLTVDNYVIQNLVSNLAAIFQAANINITLSIDPQTFQGQEFSTVFLTGSNEPAAFFNNASFGASQHVDALNADHNDQAVVFIPSLGVLGNGPDQAGVDAMIKSLTAAVARRVGELVGLRTLDNVGVGNVMAADSPTNVPNGAYRFSGTNNRLSSGFDALLNTNFYLGQQNSVNLLDRVLAPRF